MRADFLASRVVSRASVRKIAKSNAGFCAASSFQVFPASVSFFVTKNGARTHTHNGARDFPRFRGLPSRVGSGVRARNAIVHRDRET